MGCYIPNGTIFIIVHVHVHIHVHTVIHVHVQKYVHFLIAYTCIMKGTKVHNPRAILSLLKLILFLVHEFTQIICMTL